MNKILVMKCVGITLSIGGMIVSAIAGDLDNKAHLAKLVNGNK